MIGAIAGDIIGSVYEFDNHRSTEFELFTARSHFTDDTILTVAVAEALLDGGDLVDLFHDYYARYPRAGWGVRFGQWAAGRTREPYGSFGNGSAMRVSPCGWHFDSEQEVLAAAEWSAAVTHNHERGIAGAQATAWAIWLGRGGMEPTELVAEVTRRFGFESDRDVDSWRRTNEFDETCQGTLPVVFQVLAESRSFEHAVRLGVSVGGDTDTICCIVGSIAEACFGVPAAVADSVRERLDAGLRAVTVRFEAWCLDRQARC